MKFFQKLLFFFLIINSFHLFSQDRPVQIDSDYELMRCPRTNGDIQNIQVQELTVLGPDRDKTPANRKEWFASYSLNGGPAIKLNKGNAITSGNYSFELIFDNDTKIAKNISIKIVSAQRKDGSPITISTDEAENTANFKILPKPKPFYKDHKKAAKKNTTQTYIAVFNKHSLAKVSVTDGANLLSVSTSEVNFQKEVKAKVKWPDVISKHALKIVEMDPLGCVSDTIVAPIDIVDAFSVDLGKDKHICNGNSVTLVANTNIVGDYEYLWSPTNQKTKKITVTTPGKYTVYVKDKASGTLFNSSVQVFMHNPPTIAIKDHIIIEGSKVVLDISEEGATYLWSDGTKKGSNTFRNTGKYSVQKTSKYGCIATKNFKTKLRKDLFTIDLPKIAEGCGNNDLIIDPTIKPDLAYTYKWNNSKKTKSIQVNKEGTYTIEVTDPDGFIQSASTTMKYFPMPIVDLGDDKFLWDDGKGVILDAGNPGAKYLWNTGEKTQTITVKKGGVFSVEVTDNHGCSNKDDIKIKYRVGHAFGVYLGEDRSICKGDSVLITPQIEGKPTYPLSYNWVNQKHTEKEIYLKKAGKYYLIVTDANKNVEKDTIVITTKPNPIVDLGKDITSFPNQDITLDAGNTGSSYEWSTNQTTQKIKVNKKGKYWVKVTNPENCSATDTININIQEEYPFVGIPKAFTPNGDGQNDKLIIRGADSGKFDIEFMVFNRLGTKVFETTDLNNHWDGCYKGQPQDMDAYVYVLTITYPNKKKITKQGSFVLLR
jgi:gliding motility-associated-like protein